MKAVGRTTCANCTVLRSGVVLVMFAVLHYLKLEELSVLAVIPALIVALVSYPFSRVQIPSGERNVGSLAETNHWRLKLERGRVP